MNRRVGTYALALTAASLLFSSLASRGAASSISYGNLGPVPPGISFLNISESSGTDAVPLYGAPFVVGTTLSFTPTPSFAAQGSLGTSDLTDGQLNYTIAAPGGVNSVTFSEGGVYSLGNVGTAATQAFAAASLRTIVREINGLPVAPIHLTPSLGAVAYNLAAHAGANQPWQIPLSVNVAGQLAGLGYAANQVATRVDVVIDNQLVAISEAGSSASISKEAFSVTSQGVPEPSTAALAGLALCGVAGAVRRRK